MLKKITLFIKCDYLIMLILSCLYKTFGKMKFANLIHYQKIMYVKCLYILNEFYGKF